MADDTAGEAYRVGIGTDRHRLVAGRPLVLGGVEIPADVGCLGHSDGDVLLHAITDALLGAAGLGDIGERYPDTDPAYKDADSSVLLTSALQAVREAGWEPVNVDAVVALQHPRLQKDKPLMRARIADILGLSLDTVGVKAKTGEGLGPVGEGLCVDVQVVTLLRRVASAD